MNCLAYAEISSENAAKGKREAPMAEPSTEYLPPRLEAPYATYSPVQLQSLGESAQHQNAYYLSNPFVPPTAAVPSFGADYSNYGVDTLPSLEHNGNDIGNSLSQSVSNFNDVYDYGRLNNAGSIYGNSPAHLSTFNRLSQADFYGNSLNNRYPGLKSGSNQFSQPGSQFGDSYYGNAAFATPNGFNGGYSNDPTSSALTSNGPPSYAAGVKGLGHYTQPVPVSQLHTNPLKNSRPIALTSANLARKPSPFGDSNSQGSFRPSYFLGSSYVTSTSDYNQPSLTSLGTGNQYIPPSNQYLPSQSREYLPPATAGFTNNHQLPLNYATKPPGTSYGIPETLVYTRNEGKASVYRIPFGRPQ